MDVADDVIRIDEETRDDKHAKVKKLIDLWETLPKPQTDVRNSYLIIRIVVLNFLKLNMPNEAWEWSQNALPYSGIENLLGESEFLVGQAAFAKGDTETAKKYFTIAYKKSGKRIFKDWNPEYFALVDTKKKK